MEIYIHVQCGGYTRENVKKTFPSNDCRGY